MLHPDLAKRVSRVRRKCLTLLFRSCPKQIKRTPTGSHKNHPSQVPQEKKRGFVWFCGIFHGEFPCPTAMDVGFSKAKGSSNQHRFHCFSRAKLLVNKHAAGKVGLDPFPRASFWFINGCDPNYFTTWKVDIADPQI